MKKTSVFLITPLAVLAMLAAFAAPSPLAAQDELELASAVPPGALVYLEVRDLGGRLQQFLGTDFAKGFAKNRVFKDFSTSKLYNKLADRISEMEEATGFGLSLERLGEVAGGRSAFALYDIGELQFLFLSKMPLEKLAASALWDLRSSFEERQVEGRHYYFKADPDGRTALMFAVVGDTLIAGTDLMRFEAALGLLEKEGNSLAAEAKFAQAFPAGFELEDAALYIDQETISATPHFRSYWIFGNQEELSRVKRVAIGMRFGDNGIVESRWLTAEAMPSRALGDPADVLAALPRGRSIYYLGSTAIPEVLGAEIATELFEVTGEGLAVGLGAVMAQVAPADYAVAIGARFDEDEFFLTVDKTFVVRLENPRALDRNSLERTLAGYFEAKLLQQGQVELQFVERSGMRVLDLPLFDGAVPGYKLDGDLLTITNDAAAYATPAQGSLDELPEAIGSADGARSLLWIDTNMSAGHIKAFFKIISQRDNWRYSSDAAFFWRNAVALLDSIGFVDRITLLRSMDGEMEKETVFYRFSR